MIRSTCSVAGQNNYMKRLLLLAGFLAILLVPQAGFAQSCNGETVNDIPVTGVCKITCDGQAGEVGVTSPACSGQTTQCCGVPSAKFCSGTVENFVTSNGTCKILCNTQAGEVSMTSNDCQNQGLNDTCCGVPSAETQALLDIPTSTAQTGSPTTLTNPLGSGTTLFTLIQRVVQAFLGFVGAAALLVFIYAGVLWMTAASSERVQKAKDSMKYAVIGLFLIAFAYGMTVFIIDALIGNVGPPTPQQINLPPPPPPNP